MPTRRRSGLALAGIVLVALVLVPVLLVSTGALGEGDTLGARAEDLLLRLGLTDGSRYVIHDARGELDVRVGNDVILSVRVDGRLLPPERLRREGDVLVVLDEDGGERDRVPLDFARRRASLQVLHAEVGERMARISARIAEQVAARMADALAALDPPLPQDVAARLDALCRRAAEDCLLDVDRTVVSDDPDADGVVVHRVTLDEDELVEGFADAFEDAAAETGAPLPREDVARVRQALARAGAALSELEVRLDG